MKIKITKPTDVKFSDCILPWEVLLRSATALRSPLLSDSFRSSSVSLSEDDDDDDSEEEDDKSFMSF